MVFWGVVPCDVEAHVSILAKHWYLWDMVHDVISQQTVVLMFTAVQKSGLRWGASASIFRHLSFFELWNCEFKGWYRITCLKIIRCSSRQAGLSLTSHICQNVYTVGESPVYARRHQLREVSMDKMWWI